MLRKFFIMALSRKTSVIKFIFAKKMSTYTIVYPQQEKTDQFKLDSTSEDFLGVCET